MFAVLGLVNGDDLHIGPNTVSLPVCQSISTGELIKTNSQEHWALTNQTLNLTLCQSIGISLKGRKWPNETSLKFRFRILNLFYTYYRFKYTYFSMTCKTLSVNGYSWIAKALSYHFWCVLLKKRKICCRSHWCIVLLFVLLS